MKRNAIADVTAGLLGASLMLSCQAPVQQCIVARAVYDGSTGSHATVYTLQPGQDATTACAKLAPEAVGLQKFYPNGPNQQGSLAIRTARAGTLIKDNAARPDNDSSTEPFALGDFTSNTPAEDNFCEVPSLAPAVLQFPALNKTLPDGGVDARAEERHTWEWSNVRVYNSPDVPGTQYVADLTYSTKGCSARYQAKGIWPVVSCANKGKPDDDKCSSVANPDAGRPRPSGINPSFPVICDPVALICVLTGDVPSAP